MRINVSNTGSTTTAFDINNLPATRVEKGSKGMGIFLIVFSLLWGGIPTVAGIASLMKGEFKPEMLIMLIFTAIGAALFMFGLSQFFKEVVTTLDEHSVRVKCKSLFGGAKEWSEQINNYRGVVSRSEHHSSGKNNASYTLYRKSISSERRLGAIRRGLELIPVP